MYRAVPQVLAAKYRASRYDVQNDLSTDQWCRLLEISNGVCYWCKETVGIEKLGPDHVIPLSKMGPNTMENIVPSCWPCNRRKHIKDSPDAPRDARSVRSYPAKKPTGPRLPICCDGCGHEMRAAIVRIRPDRAARAYVPLCWRCYRSFMSVKYPNRLRGQVVKKASWRELAYWKYREGARGGILIGDVARLFRVPTASVDALIEAGEFASFEGPSGERLLRGKNILKIGRALGVRLVKRSEENE